MNDSWNQPHSGEHTAAALALVWDQSRSQILLVKRRDVPVWVLPGGGIEKGETPAEAACREVHEETKVSAQALRPLAHYLPVNRLAYPTHLTECQWTGGTPLPTDESVASGFFSLSNLPKPLFYIHKDWIEEVMNNREKVVQRKLTELTYRKLIKFFFQHPGWVITALIQRWRERKPAKVLAENDE